MICGGRGSGSFDDFFRNFFLEGEKEFGVGWGRGRGKGFIR